MIQFLSHRGYPVPSPACLQQIGDAFRRRVASFAEANHIPVVTLKAADRNIEVMQPYLDRAAATGRSQVAAIGVAQEPQRVLIARRVRSTTGCCTLNVLDWALTRAAGAGFASVTVACEPTGHRWRVLDQLAAARGLALVCVQPLLVYRAREGEDLTRDKSDPKDAVLIARLASELRCYEPERADAVWARLRHLGARRGQLTTGATAAVNQIRDLLECAWPAVLAASPSPFRSVTWCAALAVVLDRCAGDLSRVRRLGLDRFTAAVRRELPRWGGIRPCLRIIRAMFAALADPAGVTAHRPGALERAHLALGD